MGVFRATMLVFFFTGTSPQPSLKSVYGILYHKSQTPNSCTNRAKGKSDFFLCNLFLFEHIYKKDKRKLAARKEVQMPAVTTLWEAQASQVEEAPGRELRPWPAVPEDFLAKSHVRKAILDLIFPEFTENTRSFCITQSRHRIVRNNKMLLI